MWPGACAVLTDLQIAITDANAEATHDELPWVMADAVQLRQVFQNLINNAMKVRGDQAPRIHLSATPGNGEWTFSVRDNGIGIDPKFFNRIFVLFKRLHTREEYPETGIGLAICRKIVQKHGGKMWVESAPGEGATFFFNPAKIRGGKKMNMRPIEILLVEDNPGDARLTVELLKEGKLTNNISVVTDGVEALEYLRCEGKHGDAVFPDLILLDLNLPRMDGREVLRNMKEDPELKHIPVVILSTSAAHTDIEQSYEAHANCYVTKPVDLDKFIKVVQAFNEFWLTTVMFPRQAA